MKMKRLLAALLATTMLFGLTITSQAAEIELPRVIHTNAVFTPDATKLDVQFTCINPVAGDYAILYLGGNPYAKDYNMADGCTFTLTAADQLKYYHGTPTSFVVNIEVYNKANQLCGTRTWTKVIGAAENRLFVSNKRPNFKTSATFETGMIQEKMAKLVNNYQIVIESGTYRMTDSGNSLATTDAQGNLVIDTKECTGLSYSCAAAFSKTKTPITVQFYYADRHYQFVVPVGCDVTSYLNKEGVAGFLYLSEQLGRYDITNGTPVLVIPPMEELVKIFYPQPQQ